jgi:outer membrane receptor for ferrienterochelin and colicins
MRLVRTLVAGLALAPSLAAQVGGRITVEVRSDGVPVGQATVRSGTVVAVTDASGRAVLELPVGVREIGVSKVSFEPAGIRFPVRAGMDTTFVIALSERVEELEGIVISSTRSDKRIEDEPTRVEVLPREEVEEKTLMTPGDISMMLNETSGLRVQTTSPSLGGASVRVQGLRGRYTQILSDGLPLYGGQSGALSLLQIPPMDLEQVEVIKGGASALYGASALGGVVNLISRHPADDHELLVNQTSRGGTDAVGWLSGAPSTWGYTLLASGHRQGQRDLDGDGWADLPGYGRAVARPRLFWEPGDGATVFVTVGLMAENREGGTITGSTTPGGTPFPEDLATRRLDAGIVGRFLLGRSRLLSVRASAMGQRHRHGFGDVIERDVHGTGFGEATLGGADAGHTWLLGSAIQLDRYDARDVSGFDYVYTIPALFVQDEYAPADWLVVSGSARVDGHSEFGAFFNPRLSVLIRPGEWNARVSAGTGYFVPTPFTEETEAIGLSRLLPLGDLAVERARSVSLDVGRNMGPVELNATAFGSLIRDAFQLRFVPSAGRSELVNAEGDTRTWGTELLARYDREPFHLTGSYTFIRATETSPEATGRREVPLTPRHAVGLVGMWEAEGKGRAGLEVYYTGRQQLEENPYRDVSRPYVLIGALVERRVGGARVFVNAENLLGVRQTAFDPLVLPGRSDKGRWTTDVWAPLEGRVVNAGVRWTP